MYNLTISANLALTYMSERFINKTLCNSTQTNMYMYICFSCMYINLGMCDVAKHGIVISYDTIHDTIHNTIHYHDN